jgi:hypothetical protein
LRLLAAAEAIFSIDSLQPRRLHGKPSGIHGRKAGGPVTKADVLATLGPPIRVIGEDTGEVFVYRRLARDNRTIDLDPSMVKVFISLPSVPIYFDSETSGRDDTLMVFFDPRE